MKTTITLFLLFIVGHLAYGQTDAEKAYEKGGDAIRLMDRGKFKESIPLLEEAQALDPGNITYPYEIAYAHYAMGDYATAAAIIVKFKDHKDVQDIHFQLLGNSYDILGNSEKAIATYDEGLKKFPSSGKLFLEKGNIYMGRKEYDDALQQYEMGIEADPAFPSNYYRATILLCSSSEEVWGMLYGEIFLNLEQNSKRTSEISKLLFDTYKSEIKVSSDTSMSVSFCKAMTFNLADLQDPNNIKLPFCMIYEPTLMLSVPMGTSIDLRSLDITRSAFVDRYFSANHDRTHPNVLFSYQKTIKDAGHLEAYNYWVLMKGDEVAFNKWKAANEMKWRGFITWFTANPLKLNRSNRFYRRQY